MRGYYLRRALASSCGLKQTASQAGVRPGSKSKDAVVSVRSVSKLQQVAVACARLARTGARRLSRGGAGAGRCRTCSRSS